MSSNSTSIHDVAAFVLAYFEKPISTMKLQKLCFFAQGWSLGLARTEIFPESFSAWRNGPVNWNLYEVHRGQFSVHSWPEGDPKALDVQSSLIVEAVLENFGALSGIELSELTHRPGTPWDVARKSACARDGERANERISKSVMQRYFQTTLT